MKRALMLAVVVLLCSGAAVYGYIKPGAYPTSQLPSPCTFPSIIGDSTTLQPKVCIPDAGWVAFGAAGGVTTAAPVQGNGSGGSPITLTTCSASQVYKMAGTPSVWTCAADADSGGDITGVGYVTSGGLQGGASSGQADLGLMTCAAGKVLKSTGVGTWDCADDTDTNTTYTAKAARGLLLTSTAFGLLESCSHGQMLKWDSGASGEWVCSDDTDTNTTYTAKASGGLALDGTEFRAMTCAAGKVLKSTGVGTWDCADDTDTNTTYTAKAYEGLALTGTAFGLIETCSPYQLLKWGMPGSELIWSCADDTDTNTTYTAGDGLTLTVTDFDCDAASITAPGCVTADGTPQTFNGAKTFDDGVLSTTYGSATTATYGATTTTTVTSGTSTTVQSGTGALTLLSGTATLRIGDKDGDVTGIDWEACDRQLDLDLNDGATCPDNVLGLRNSGTGVVKLSVDGAFRVGNSAGAYDGSFIYSTYAGSYTVTPLNPIGGWACAAADVTAGDLAGVAATDTVHCSGNLADTLIVTCHAIAGGVRVKVCNHSADEAIPEQIVYIRTFGANE